MSKIINGVVSEYDMPMKYENKKMTVFIDTQDMEERHSEELYKEYLENENKQLKGQNKQIRENNEELKRRLKSVQDKRDSHKCIRYKQQKALQDIKKILDTLETYSSNQDVLNDYNKRASKIRDIVNKALGIDSNE